jgi:hypothetical protein
LWTQAVRVPRAILFIKSVSIMVNVRMVNNPLFLMSSTSFIIIWPYDSIARFIIAQVIGLPANRLPIGLNPQPTYIIPLAVFIIFS